MNPSRHAFAVAQAVRPLLSHEGPFLPNEYRYAHVSLALIDAIYSLNARYESVRRTVLRYADHAGLTPYRPSFGTWPPQDQQQPLRAFLKNFDALGVSPMAEQVFMNRQRTSPRNGILKAEAVRDAARLLSSSGVAYFQDIPRVMQDPQFESASDG